MGSMGFAELMNCETHCNRFQDLLKFFPTVETGTVGSLPYVLKGRGELRNLES